MHAILRQLQQRPDEAYISFRDAIIQCGRMDLVEDYLPVIGAVSRSTTELPGASTGAAAHVAPPAVVQENTKSDEGRTK